MNRKRRFSRASKARSTSTRALGAKGAHSASAAPIRVLLCDDQILVRTCVRQILQQTGSIEVVGEASLGKAAVALALKLKPEIVLMEVSLPDFDGIQAARKILAKLPFTRILAFTADSSVKTIKKMFAAGACGYLLKTGDAMDLVVALHKVLAGACFITGAASDFTRRPRRD
jgi:two-component system response regulator NreC